MKKRIKDPIYGYIEIEEELFDKVIDSPQFQRLRNIIQTSYTSLYPSTSHNRFVHSLGVYHLGVLSALSVRRKMLTDSWFEEERSVLEDYKNVFEVACLLHDVGHAPFSHTGENFFLRDGSREELHSTIVSLSSDEELRLEIENNGYKAAPHELMSAIIGLESFGDIIDSEKKGFFVRCICGYRYVDNGDAIKQILNCYIELLNSKVLDVDKIDYLLRDAYMSGFDTVSIDYERLVGNVFFIKDETGFHVAYGKAALSVLENVVFAHDLEKKWIQTHPTVVYESYLVTKLMEEIINKWFSTERCFPREALGRNTIISDECGSISYLSDADVIHFMKNLKGDSRAEEYFDRRKRKHPLWKTEAEYKALFDDQKSIMDEIQNVLDMLLKNQKNAVIEINDSILERLNEEIYEIGKLIDDSGDTIYESNIQNLEKQKELVEIFHEFCILEGIDFDFVILFTDQFNSGFKRPEFSDILFQLPLIKKLMRFIEISNVFKQPDSTGDRFFYVYCKKNKDKKMPSAEYLIRELMSYGGKLNSDRTADKIRRNYIRQSERLS